jgi:hypothetical protein
LQNFSRVGTSLRQNLVALLSRRKFGDSGVDVWKGMTNKT